MSKILNKSYFYRLIKNKWLIEKLYVLKNHTQFQSLHLIEMGGKERDKIFWGK